MLDIKDLEAFLAILDGGSISKAAEQLGLTQPALSLKLKKMELELGAKLFQRTSRNVVPLESSRVIEAKVRDMLGKFDSIKEALATSISEMKGQVRVGCVTGWFETLVLPTVARLRQDTPLIRFRLHADHRENLMPMLMHGQLDMAIVAQPFESLDGIQTTLLLEEELVLIGKNLPKFDKKEDLQRELLKRPWIAMSTPDPLIEKYWAYCFDGEVFPWEKVQIPVLHNHILSVPQTVLAVPGAVAVVPAQITRQIKALGLEASQGVSNRNGLYLASRADGFDLKRYAVVHDAIIAQAQEYVRKNSSLVR